MRQRIVRAVVAVSMVTGVSLAFGYAEGPPVSRTGAPAVATLPAEGLCTSCHVGYAPNDPAGQLQILHLPQRYVPGQTYNFIVRLGYTHVPADSVAPYRWGFELTAVQAANGRGAGTLVPGGPDQQMLPGQTTFASRTYLEHTILGNHDGEVGPVEWMCTWVAPLGDSGTVYFFAAGNAGNGDNQPYGDHIFTSADTVESGGTIAAVEGGPLKPYSFSVDPPFPNPFTRFTDFPFSVPRDGVIDFSVFDLQGRHVKTLRSGFHRAGLDGLTWWGDRDDGSPAPAGVYFARLRVQGERDQVSRRVALTR